MYSSIMTNVVKVDSPLPSINVGMTLKAKEAEYNIDFRHGHGTNSQTVDEKRDCQSVGLESIRRQLAF
jgi:hypothetical protein